MASSSTSRAPAPSSIALPPAGFDSALDTPESTPGTSPLPGRSFQAGQPSLGAPGPHRISFSQAALTGQRNHRPSGASSRRYTGARRMSAASRARSLIDNEDGALTEDELRPVVPSLFHTGLIRKEPDATPLPLLPMIVLGIAMMGEMLSANVSSPFILAMVKSFGLDPVGVGVWTGNTVAAFFLTQFFTSLLWATIADQYGRRAVLFTTLLGGGLTVILFGTSKSLPEAVAVRLAQGIFSGGIGVVRSGIKDVTDPTNEAKAYAILGFVWGFGGVIGPVIGGLAESPAKNHPNSYVGQLPLFKTYPYLFPCLLASTILLTGAVLSLFLNRDGGSRFGGIALPIEKDTSADDPTTSGPLQTEGSPLLEPSSSPAAGPKQLAKRLSGYFARRVQGLQGTPSRASFTSGAASVPLADASVPKRRAVSSAYGYGTGRSGGNRYRPSFSSDATVRMERGADAGEDYGVREEHLGSGLFGTLTERLLLANEAASGNTLGDLWLSQALAQDQESVFESEDDQDEDADVRDLDAISDEDALSSASPSAAPSPSTSRIARHSTLSPGPGASQDPSPLSPHARRLASRSQLGVEPSQHFPGHHRLSTLGTYAGRRMSAMSARPPSLFQHTGLQSPHKAITSPAAGGEEQDPFAATIAAEGLAPISEGTPARFATTDVAPAKQPSALRKLPLFLIFQYFALALHDTINGQLFLSILNSDYAIGGLGLSPSHFSTLIALMCGFQIVYQFYLYPKLGPPLGPLSHIQMFRLGAFLYIPAYLTTPLLRAFASAGDDGSPFLMFALTINMACRYAGGTLSYTSVMILTNAMSPPEVVNLANGLAQSSVSAARVLGPIAGGLLWSFSEAEGDTSLGFTIVACACTLALCSSFLLR